MNYIVRIYNVIIHIYVDFMYDFIVIKLDSFFAVTRRKSNNMYLAIFNVLLVIIFKCNYYQLHNNVSYNNT